MADAFDSLVTDVATGTVSINVGSGGGSGWSTGTMQSGVYNPINMPAYPSVPPAYVVERYDTIDDVREKGISIEDMTRIGGMKSSAIRAIDIVIESLPALTITHDRARIEHSLVVAGGFFASRYHGEKPRDIDVFILNSPNMHKAFRDAIDYSEKSSATYKDRFKYGTAAYLTAMNNKILQTALDNQTTIQYIFTEYNSRQELIDHFDAEHDCVSYHRGTLFASPLTIDCIRNKILKSHRGNTIAQWRVDKFMKRGFRFAS